jgi:23S rRNA (uracil-5-)-methyltransferase RumA
MKTGAPPAHDASARLTCPHGEDCGACGFLGIAYKEQLRQKRDLLGKELRRYRRLRRANLLETLPSPRISGYRNRARMAVGLSRHHDASLGYYRAGTREIVDAPECRVLVPEVLDTTRRIRTFLAATPNIPRVLRHVDVRCGSNPSRQHLILVFRSAKRPRFPLAALSEACPGVDGISVNLNPSKGPQVLRGPVEPAWGEREIWVDHAGVRLRVSPGSFFQVNLGILPAIHERMRSFLRGGKLLADLYAGVGTHGLALGANFKRILFCEGTRGAAADLKATLLAQKISSAEVMTRSVERTLPQLRERAPTAFVLNPSRPGAQESVLEAVADTPATRVAYLSCEPQTLCRDLDVLARKGFETVSVQPIDMMPQTRQVEALALLVRKTTRRA